MKSYNKNLAVRFVIALVIAIPLLSGIIEDSISDEVKYPNVVKPIIQFGSYGNSASLLNEPLAADFSEDNKLFVLESNNNRVQCFSIDGKSIFAFGKQGSGVGEFISPTSLCVYKSLIYVCDAGNDRIQVFDLTGHHKKSFGKHGYNSGEFNNPYGVYVANDKIFVADESNNRVQVFDINFTFLFSFGKWGKGNGEFIHPTDVVVSEKGYIFVCDSKNNRIQKFNPDGSFIKVWGSFGSYGGLMATPTDLEIYKNEILVTDLINHRFQAFDLDGKYIYQWGRHPTIAHEGNGRTHYPVGIAISNDGDFVAVCEPIENRIQIFKKADINKSKPVDDFAWWDKKARFHYGSGASTGGNALIIGEPDTHMVLVFDITDGPKPILLAKFGGYGNNNGEINMPSGIAYDSKKSLIYISDKGNNRIQGFKFDFLKAKHLIDSTEKMNLDSIQKNYTTYSENSTSTSYSFTLGGDIGFKNNEFNEPSGLTLSPNGYLYAVDNGNCRIKVFDQNYNLIRTFGEYGNGPGELKSPISISYSGKGDRIYVMDQHNYRIQVFDTLGQSLFSFGSPGDEDGQFVLPFGLTVGRDGSVYVTDEGDHSVKKFTSEGKFIKKWGSWGVEKGMFYKPKGIAQGKNGLLYVLDFGNHRGQIFEEDGRFVNFFGLGELQNGIFKKDPNEITSEKSKAGYTQSQLNRGYLWATVVLACTLVGTLIYFLRKRKYV